MREYGHTDISLFPGRQNVMYLSMMRTGTVPTQRHNVINLYAKNKLNTMIQTSCNRQYCFLPKRHRRHQIRT